MGTAGLVQAFMQLTDGVNFLAGGVEREVYERLKYGCLLPRGIDNLLVAGRCVSTDRYLQGSLRAMPGCYITGQAAGMAAALAVESGHQPRMIDTGALQSRLKAMGAYLPNAE